jgi:hypothetical protein
MVQEMTRSYAVCRNECCDGADPAVGNGRDLDRPLWVSHFPSDHGGQSGLKSAHVASTMRGSSGTPHRCSSAAFVDPWIVGRTMLYLVFSRRRIMPSPKP